jgi:hypothetical protein
MDNIEPSVRADRQTDDRQTTDRQAGRQTDDRQTDRPDDIRVQVKAPTLPLIANATAGLAANLLCLNVLSSTKIRAKVARALDHLAEPARSPPNLVLLCAAAPAAGKLITIVEVAKREIGRQGAAWYQYTRLGRETAAAATTSTPMDECDDSAFETMETPLPKAEAGQKRPGALLGVFLSRVRVESLRTAHGEQTNA